MLWQQGATLTDSKAPTKPLLVKANRRIGYSGEIKDRAAAIEEQDQSVLVADGVVGDGETGIARNVEEGGG